MAGRQDGPHYAIQVIHFGPVDPIKDSLDVFVHFEDGSRFVGSFFTLANVHLLFEKFQTTGECDSGAYLWSSDMILVRDYSDAVIGATVRDLLATRLFERAFSRCEEGSDPPWTEAARSGPSVRVVWGLHPS